MGMVFFREPPKLWLLLLVLLDTLRRGWYNFKNAMHEPPKLLSGRFLFNPGLELFDVMAEPIAGVRGKVKAELTHPTHPGIDSSIPQGTTSNCAGWNGTPTTPTKYYFLGRALRK